MAMNRRNVLIGLGAIAAGGGAVFGTGAFSQVEADRTVSVDVAGDANAFLALDANDSLSTGAIDNAGGSGNALRIDLSSSFGGGSGVNNEAVTTIGELDSLSNPTDVVTAAFTITNNGDSAVDIATGLDGDTTSILSLPTQVPSSDHDDGSTDFSSVADLTSNDLAGLASGGSADVVVKVDTTGADNTGSDAVTGITFTATTV